jgi:hypothetical protein
VKEHGKHSTYSKGCRCEPCTVAHREYSRERARIRRLKKKGLIEEEPRWISAEKSREHLLHLKSCGIGLTFVSSSHHLHKANLQAIRNGKQKWVSRETEQKILAVTDCELHPKHFVDAKFTMSLIKELNDAGYNLMDLNAMLGKKTPHQKLITGKYVRLETQERILELHFSLLRRPPKMLKPFPRRSGQIYK